MFWHESQVKTDLHIKHKEDAACKKSLQLFYQQYALEGFGNF